MSAWVLSKAGGDQTSIEASTEAAMSALPFAKVKTSGNDSAA